MRFSKTPLRVSLFGGGTDDPRFFNQSSGRGSVTGFAIDQFIWIFASQIQVNQGFKFRLGYKASEDVLDAGEIKHPIFREVLRDQSSLPGYHFCTMSTLPSGAGLGSSSSFTVGLLALLNSIQNDSISRASLANEAIRYEREVLGESGGWQDQLHASFGGVNTFEFNSNTWVRKPVELTNDNLRLLSDSLYIVFTGKLRSASAVEESKISKTNKDDLLSETFALALEGERALRRNQISLHEVGYLLNKGWQLKRRLSSAVSSSEIDAVYEQILATGAYGAKLCGAGGGGFFLALADSSAAAKISETVGFDKIMKVGIFDKGVEVGVL